MAIKKNSTSQTATMACVRCKAKHARCQRESPNSPCNRCNWNKVECEDPEPQTRAARTPTPPPNNLAQFTADAVQQMQQHAAYAMAYQQTNAYSYQPQVALENQQLFYEVPSNYGFQPKYPSNTECYQPLPEFYHHQHQQPMANPPSPPYDCFTEPAYPFSAQYYGPNPVNVSVPVPAMEGPMSRLYQSGDAEPDLRDVWGSRSDSWGNPRPDSWAYNSATPNLSDDGSSFGGSDVEYEYSAAHSPASSVEYPQDYSQYHHAAAAAAAGGLYY